MKIKGLKKAVGEYKKSNSGGYYDPRYGVLMLDRKSCEVWVDEFYSIGHNDFKIYHDNSIINLSKKIIWNEEEINMKTVKKYAIELCEEYKEMRA